MEFPEPMHGGLDPLSALHALPWWPESASPLIESVTALVDDYLACYERLKPLIGEVHHDDPTIRVVDARLIVADAFEALRPPGRRRARPSWEQRTADAKRELAQIAEKIDRHRAPLVEGLQKRLAAGEGRWGLVAFCGRFGERGGRLVIPRGFWTSPDVRWLWSELSVETATERLINVRLYRVTDEFGRRDRQLGREELPTVSSDLQPAIHDPQPSKTGAPRKGYRLLIESLIEAGAIRRDTRPGTAQRLMRDEQAIRREVARERGGLFEDTEIPDTKKIADALRRIWTERDPNGSTF